MKTCGECGHFEAGKHGRYGYCRCDVPVWVFRSIDNVAGTTACSDNDTQANDCDKFCNRQLMEPSIVPTMVAGMQCPDCDGRGYFVETCAEAHGPELHTRKCEFCDGTGRVLQEDAI